MGSVSVRANKYSLIKMGVNVRSGGLQYGHCGCSATEKAEPAVGGGHMLMWAGPGAEEVTQLTVASTEPVSRSWALEAKHSLVAAFDTAVIPAPVGC